MKKIYQDQWLLFKQSYLKYFIGLFLFFIVAGFLAYYYMQNNQGLLDELMRQIYEMFEETDLLNEDLSSLSLAIGLFVNNTRASFLIAATGFIPIFLPTLGILFFNGAIIGVLFAYMNVKAAEVSIFSMFVSGILPHGIFEIPAVILSGAIAFYVTFGIYRRFNDSRYSFRDCVMNAAKTFLFVVVPLLVVAAFVESFITPQLIGLMQ